MALAADLREYYRRLRSSRQWPGAAGMCWTEVVPDDGRDLAMGLG
ncbi:hypothetical protein ACWDR1_23160 [Streptosporangium sandarakinum]